MISVIPDSLLVVGYFVAIYLVAVACIYLGGKK